MGRSNRQGGRAERAPPWPAAGAPKGSWPRLLVSTFNLILGRPRGKPLRASVIASRSVPRGARRHRGQGA